MFVLNCVQLPLQKIALVRYSWILDVLDFHSEQAEIKMMNSKI